MQKITLYDLIEARNRVNNAIGSIANQNTIHEASEQLGNLESILAEFEKRGEFDTVDDQRQLRGGWNIEKKNSEEKKDDSYSVIQARVIVARTGLRLLQKALPAIEQIAAQCLEVAGRDAVRTACAPTPREGTDSFGKPFGSMPSEFTLPAGYETLAAKLKTAIGG